MEIPVSVDSVSVEDATEGLLRVLKRYPEKIVIMSPPESPATKVMEGILSELGIGYRVLSDYGIFKDIKNQGDKSFYSLDLTSVHLNGTQPDLEKLRDYWRNGPEPRTL